MQISVWINKCYALYFPVKEIHHLVQELHDLNNIHLDKF